MFSLHVNDTSIVNDIQKMNLLHMEMMLIKVAICYGDDIKDEITFSYKKMIFIHRTITLFLITKIIKS